MKVQITINGRPTVIGTLIDNTFTKTVKESKHLFIKGDAWGIDAKYFTDVLLPRNTKIIVEDTENNKVYETTAEEMKKHGFYMTFKGHEPQIFLSRRNFKCA